MEPARAGGIDPGLGLSLPRVEESHVQLYARRLEVIRNVESRCLVLADALHESDVEGEQGVVASFDASKFRNLLT